MLNLKQNISLKQFNTFSIDVKAKLFIDIKTLDELKKLLITEKDFFILSGGSNLLLTKDIDKLVIHLNLKGKEVLHSKENHLFVKVQAGENWHEFVLWCIDHNYGGIENLSLIPGNVGTTPIQNIGAYGTEVKDTIYEVEALEIDSNISKKFTNVNLAIEIPFLKMP
jgi:UDP-N-acetylmuramate dehydrogenase